MKHNNIMNDSSFDPNNELSATEILFNEEPFSSPISGRCRARVGGGGAGWGLAGGHAVGAAPAGATDPAAADAQLRLGSRAV